MSTAAGTRLSPSSASISLLRKAEENLMLLRAYVQRSRTPVDFRWLSQDLAEYDELLRAHASTSLRDARIFEVGYGARPYRLMALQSLGLDASGVDIEQPLLGSTLREVAGAWRANGPERALKSLIRSVAFDPGERRALRGELASLGASVAYDTARMLVSDAADVELPTGSVDLVISEEVLQQVELPSLHRIVENVHRWLRPGGLALLRPNVFTGITGSMLQEWSRWSLEHPPRRRRSEPWEHLRNRRFEPNAFVNGLTRADYRELFSRHFELIDERVKRPGLGREYLTPEVAAELAGFSEEELLSNVTMFVLRKAA
jgi:SAM-dependent methyltransferase